MPTLTETSLPTCASYWLTPPKLDQRFATGDPQRHTGHESAAHREQYRAGNVVRSADSTRWIAGGDVHDVIPLAVVAERIPSPRVDDARLKGTTRIEVGLRPALRQLNSALISCGAGEFATN